MLGSISKKKTFVYQNLGFVKPIVQISNRLTFYKLYSNHYNERFVKIKCNRLFLKYASSSGRQARFPLQDPK